MNQQILKESANQIINIFVKTKTKFTNPFKLESIGDFYVYSDERQITYLTTIIGQDAVDELTDLLNGWNYTNEEVIVSIAHILGIANTERCIDVNYCDIDNSLTIAIYK